MPETLAVSPESGGREEDRSLQVARHRTEYESAECTMDREESEDSLFHSRASKAAAFQVDHASGGYTQGWDKRRKLVPGGSVSPQDGGGGGREGGQAPSVVCCRAENETHIITF